MSLSRVVEYLCLASPKAHPESSVWAGIQVQTSRQSERRAERAWGSGRTREPVTILSRLGVLACVLGFCLHGLISFASTGYQVASSVFALVYAFIVCCVLWFE